MFNGTGLFDQYWVVEEEVKPRRNMETLYEVNTCQNEYDFKDD